MFELITSIIQGEQIAMTNLLIVGLIGVVWIVLWKLPQIIEQYRLLKRK